MIDYLPIVLTGIGIIVAIIYYTLTLRNATKTQQMQLETRQAQLLMNIMNTFRSTEFRTQWHLIWERIDLDTDSFSEEMQNSLELRTAWTSVMTYFESVGVLVRNQMINIGLIHSLMGLSIKSLWEGFEHFIIKDREYLRGFSTSSYSQDAWDDFEYLYNEIIKYESNLKPNR